jgi:hypothetical protein
MNGIRGFDAPRRARFLPSRHSRAHERWPWRLADRQKSATPPRHASIRPGAAPDPRKPLGDFIALQRRQAAVIAGVNLHLVLAMLILIGNSLAAFGLFFISADLSASWPKHAGWSRMVPTGSFATRFISLNQTRLGRKNISTKSSIRAATSGSIWTAPLVRADI